MSKSQKPMDTIAILSPRPSESWRLAMRIAQHGWQRGRRKTLVIDMDPSCEMSLAVLGRKTDRFVTTNDRGIGLWYYSVSEGINCESRMEELVIGLHKIYPINGLGCGLIAGWIYSEDEISSIFLRSILSGFGDSAAIHLRESVQKGIVSADRVVFIMPPGLGWISRMGSTASRSVLAIIRNDELFDSDMHRVNAFISDYKAYDPIADSRYERLRFVGFSNENRILSRVTFVPHIVGESNDPLIQPVQPETMAALDQVIDPVWGLRPLRSLSEESG